MKKEPTFFKHQYIFAIIIVFCTILIAYIHISLNTTENISNSNLSHDIITLDDVTVFDGNYETVIDDINDFKTDNNVIIKGTFPTDLQYNSSLVFYSLHQNVTVQTLVDGEYVTIYTFLRSDEDLKFGSTPGHAYNVVENIYQYAGNEFVIELNSPYGIDNTSLPTLLIGADNDIVSYDFSKSAGVIVTSLIIIILGSFAFFVWAIFKKYIIRGDFTLLYASVFSFTVAIWTINEQPVISYFVNNSIITAYISFITLMLVPIGLVLFFRELCKTKENPIWDIALLVNYSVLIVTSILQILNKCDYKDCLTFIQIVFATSALVIFVYSTYITFKKHTTDGWINFICVICLYVGYFIYLYEFFVNKLDKLYYGSILVIVYLIIIMTMYIRKSITYMIKSDQVEFYENLAYRDSLTELFNRLAYDTAIANVDLKEYSYIIVIFDLNNLKYFNDTYGHNIGDTYIKDSSNLIKEAFKNLGNLYRIGGDEFCIILQDKSIFQYETAVRELDTAVYNYNRVSDILKINIAYGYAQYDKKIDRDIYETRNRADAMMYEKKFYMKQNQVPLV